MEKEFVDSMRSSLFNLKEEIINKLVAESKDFKEIIEDMDPKDLVDIAADDIDRKTLEALSAGDIRKLNLIDSAISRLQNGKYGICMSCNKKIPRERLEAMPYALMCIDCKTADERRNR
ncbi:MAG: TraR/DksA family transcriptional regulator [Spirochaetales bacterium]|nr:MAG: TraR/DksA family transcriptional regulator [Spirochaetales bacterium]